MSKIIDFPGGKNIDENVKEQNKKASELSLTTRKKMEVYDHVDEYCVMLIDSLADMGYDVDALSFQQDFTIVAQTLESCLMRSIGVKHQMQSIVDALLKAASSVDPDKDL